MQRGERGSGQYRVNEQLGLMLAAATEARDLIAHEQPNELARDRLKSLALERLLQRLADAARRIRRDKRTASPQVPWTKLDLLAKTISTSSREIDARVLYAIVLRDAPELIDALRNAIITEED